MASHGSVQASSLSLRHGIRCVTNAGESVEDVLLDVAERVGHDNIVSASQMNKAVVVFLKDERLVTVLIESGISVSGAFIQVQPLATPTSKVTISNVPPFIPNADIERELSRFGKLASGIKMVPLGCKNAALKHVMSFRRHVFMFLNSQNLNVSFRCMYEGKSYMLYASAGEMRCFECGAFGHVRLSCPNKTEAGPSGSETAVQIDPHVDQVVVVNVENVRNNEEVPTERVINDEVSESVRKDEESSVENELMDDGDVEVQMSETKVDSRIEGRMSRDCVVTRSGRNEDQRRVREVNSCEPKEKIKK